MGAGDFCIISPDNDATRDIANRPHSLGSRGHHSQPTCIIRWHPDDKEEFTEFLTLDAPFRR